MIDLKEVGKDDVRMKNIISKQPTTNRGPPPEETSMEEITGEDGQTGGAQSPSIDQLL